MLLDGVIPATTPKCASPVLTSLLKAFQAGVDGSVQAQLASYFAQLPGSQAPTDVERARGLVSVEYSVKVFLPRALAAVPDLQHLANGISALEPLSNESHDVYVAAVADLVREIRTHVAKDPLARGASVMKAVYQVQHLLEQYRVRPPSISADIIASAFSRIKGDPGAVELLERLFAIKSHI